jgi:peptide/nickel transport system substrate-binding protein
MANDYWHRILDSRVSRRRGMAAVGAGAAAAAFLAACGGSDKSSSTSGGTDEKSSLITKPVDTTKSGKRGGTLKFFTASEPAHLDVQLDQASANQHKNMVYGHFVNEKAGVLKAASYEEYAPEMMESWEWSPDRLKLTFKMRQNVKWHNKPPVSGRLMDTEDVLFSWNRYAARGTDRSFLSNAANPNAPVLNVTAPDARTIVFSLREPVTFLIAALTPAQTGKPNIIPKETDKTFDIRQDMIGTGPFILDKYTPTVGFVYKRNPDYWDKDFPLVDTLEIPIVREYAQAMAQVRAGAIYAYSYDANNRVRNEDILPLKRDTPEMKIYSAEPSGFSVRSLVFGWPPTEANKPFKDERVRQAISMTWDRDAYVGAFKNADKFKADGLPVNTYWNTAISAGAGSWWLDPKGKDFGPNAKYFQRDIAEAKKLLAAAGYPNGVDVTSSYIGGTQLGADFQRQVGVTDEFAKEAGFRVKPNIIDYTSQYITTYRDGNGKYDGWLYRAGGAPANDAAAYFSTLFHSKYGGPGFLGFDPAGKGDGSGDPALEAMLDKARVEIDTQKRKALINDMQRYLAKAVYGIPHEPGDATIFYTAWPAVQNFQTFQGDRRGSTAATFSWWLDETQAPLKK